MPKAQAKEEAPLIGTISARIPDTIEEETYSAFSGVVENYLPECLGEAAAQARALEPRMKSLSSVVTIRAKINLTGRVAKIENGRITITTAGLSDMNEHKQVATWEAHLPTVSRDLDQTEFEFSES
jgi:hypothetical protein